jgi:hypothetical protein
LAQRKLDAVGFIHAHCCYANNKTRIRRFKAAAQLTASLAEITRFTQEEASHKKAAKANKFKEIAPAALQKYRAKGLLFVKLTIAEIRAMAYEYFNQVIPSSAMLKAQVVEVLQRLYIANPGRIDNAVII